MLLTGLLIQIIVIPTFLFISVFFPQTQAIFIPLWIACLLLDLSSTHKFYLENPTKFQTNERNKLFGYLTAKVGFKKAAFIFPLAIEIPLLLFFALLPLQILHIYLFPNTPNNFIACLTTSFGIAATGHLHAAVKNNYINKQSRV